MLRIKDSTPVASRLDLIQSTLAVVMYRSSLLGSSRRTIALALLSLCFLTTMPMLAQAPLGGNPRPSTAATQTSALDAFMNVLRSLF